MHVSIRASDESPPRQQPVEVVERKGLGHPDTICDAIAEEISRALCREYLERFGAILHHNVDKVLLVGGTARPVFAGGEVTDPIEIYLAGRATHRARGQDIPVERIASEACRSWLAAHIRNLDVQRHVRIIAKLRRGSQDLTTLFSRGAAGSLANDTSCGVGFAPLSDLERVVASVEAALNAPSTKREHPAIGEDVKVMGTRVEGRLRLTIGCALVSRHVNDIGQYLRVKDMVPDIALAASESVSSLPVEVVVNAADDPGNADVFLTVTGTSAESGDDGEVGRGNRANGLITPYRPMTLEAAAGKNPVTHVGTLYNILAMRIADSVVRELDDVTDAACVLVSSIGHPVDEPALVDVRLALRSGTADAHSPRVRQLIADGFAQLGAIREELLEGTLTVY